MQALLHQGSSPEVVRENRTIGKFFSGFLSGLYAAVEDYNFLTSKTTDKSSKLFYLSSSGSSNWQQGRQSSPWYVLPSQSHLLKVLKCLGKAVQNVQQHLSGEKPAQTKLMHWVVSWWHFRAPKESWPPSVSSDSLPNLKKLCLLVWLFFAALKPVTKLKLNVEFVLGWKPRSSSAGTISDILLWLQTLSEKGTFCWKELSRYFVFRIK